MAGFSLLEILLSIFQFIGGFGMFLYGMHIMSDGLQKAASNKMRNILEKLTKNRFTGLLFGAALTALIQSSSATTVMVVGFVNASLVTLEQAVGVIMGANIGTTVTSLIVSSSEWFDLLKPEEIAPLAIGIGAIMLFFMKQKKNTKVGEILVGIGLLFIGLSFMSGAIKPYRELEAFRQAFIVLGRNPLFGVLAGALVTAIIQSSSASVGILQTIAKEGLVPWNAAVYIVLGQNIGTTVTALLSSVKAGKTAKRAAIIHLIFNVVGTFVFTIGAVILFKFVIVEIGEQLVYATDISKFHIFFNVASTAMLYPFANLLVKISKKIIPGEDVVVVNEADITLKHLDDRILESPQFAVENSIKEVVRMGEYALLNLRLSVKSFINKDIELADTVLEREKQLNRLERLITDYLVKISTTSLNEHQILVINNLFHIVNDIERIGDHAENIAELAQYFMNNQLSFTDKALEEFSTLANITVETVEYSLVARRDMVLDAIKRVEKNEELVDNLEDQYRTSHISRLATGVCQTTSGVIFLDTISNLERITDLSLNIALYVKDEIM